MALLDTLIPSRKKSEIGVGAYWMSNENTVSSMTRDPLKLMREAQSIAVSNRWIRAAERLISSRFSTVPYHLEDADDNEVTDESPPAYLAVRDLIERPYSPRPGDPVTATPRTRAGLWSITSRHMGVCGVSYWYLDQTEQLAGTPLQCLYLNPARVWPVQDDHGSLLGYLLDSKNGQGGTPLELHQVVPFYLEPPDFGWFPAGLVETAMNDVLLMKYGDRHATLTLSSGGRIPGVFSPKAGSSISPDQWEQLKRDLRTATESPDATRRSLILGGPIEFTTLAANPSELDLMSIMSMARDDILALWGVPYSQLGGTATGSGGMNSGERQGYEEAALHQNAVGPRLRAFAETVQLELLDRYKELGIEVELEIEEPTFDDDTPMFLRAKDAAGLPLTNMERRAMVNLPPTGDPLIDNAIMLPTLTSQMFLAPDMTVKAKLEPKLDPIRERAITDVQKNVNKVLDAMRAEVSSKSAHMLAKPKDDSWWREDHWRKELERAILPAAALAAETVPVRIEASLGKADLGLPARVLAALLKKVGLRIGGILDTTREMVRGVIRDGIERGLSAAELGRELQTAGAFGEYRAETIARTETAHVLNGAALESYKEYGITQVVADDGDQDEECAARAGQTFDIAEAEDIEDHPNGTLSWSPVVETAKASIEPRPQPRW